VTRARWHVKRRTIEAAKANPNRPRGQVAYGPWQIVSDHATLAEAEAARETAAARGLYDVAVFFRARRITR